MTSGHLDAISAITFSPKSDRLASASRDGTVRVWDVVSAKEIVQFGAHRTWPDEVAFSPDGKMLASLDMKEICLWDPATGRVFRRLSAKDGLTLLRCLAFSPDGKNLAIGTAGGGIYIWDIDAARIRDTVVPTRHRVSEITSLTYSPDGNSLAAVQLDKTCQVWDMPTKKVRWRTSSGPSACPRVAFAPDGKTLALGLGFNSVALWDVASGTRIGEIPDFGQGLGDLAFSPRGNVLAGFLLHGGIALLNPETGKTVAQFEGHESSGIRLAFSPDGRKLASASRDSTILIWDVDKYTQGKEKGNK